MATLDIIEIGHPSLREVASEVPVDQIKHADVQEFIDALIETSRHAGAVGIAANQVDKLWRIFVVEVADNPVWPTYPLTVVINPTITYLTEDRFENYEGCLSIPRLRGVVHRCPVIQVTGYDRNALSVDFEVRGVAASIFQHETDHLNGVLFPDRLIDPRTLSTNEEFVQRYAESFRQVVQEVEALYNAKVV